LSGPPNDGTPSGAAAACCEPVGDRRGRFSQSGEVIALVAKFAGAGRYPEHREDNLALSSLDRVELMSALEQRYQVELSETAFAEAKTVADVERLLRLPAARRTDYAYPRWTQRAPIRWLRLTVYYALVWPATQILGHPKIVGRENLRGLRGPVLVVSNHITRRADIGLILAALPPRFRHRLATAMGGETLQRMRRPPRDWFFAKRWAYHAGYWLVIALFNVFPLPQLSGFRESFHYAGESTDRGYSVLVFPEGEVNESATGEMAKFQSGIGLLAENLRVPIVPMRLDGVWKMKREHRRLAHLGEITVHIGKPIAFPPGTGPGEIARQLESLVQAR
jgi:long-chain acyl-CoA synthetase